MSLAIYLHFPFCKNLCHYCDFYKIHFDDNLQQHYFSALSNELEIAYQQLNNKEKTISSIYIGGGTPSLLNIDLLSKWLQQLNDCFPFSSTLEFSFEANPESIDRDKLICLQQLGVTRPTYGIQSFDQKLLEILGRIHNPHDSQQAVYFSHALGFKSFSLDQIFGVPTQSGKTLSADIDQMIDLNPPHISFYQLVIEEGTMLNQKITNGELKEPEQELLLAMYKSGCEKFADAGYTRYEILSFAKEGHECRHNINYWMGGEYLGFGPAAHSFVDNQRFMNYPDLKKYIDTLQNKSLPREVDQSGERERMVETILLGLRTMWGVNKEKFSRRYKTDISTIINQEQYAQMLDDGFIVEEGDSFKLTDEGIYISDEITQQLLK